MFEIPGNMVVAASSSAVMSAACHCIPTESVELADIDPSSSERLLESEPRDDSDAEEDRRTRMLYNMSIQELKWGIVSPGNGTAEYPGHLAFGTMDQEIQPPIIGRWYAGSGS